MIVARSTLEFKVNFARPLTIQTNEVICEGKVLHYGERVATAEAKVFDGSGNLYAHATTTCLCFRTTGRNGAGIRPAEGTGDEG